MALKSLEKRVLEPLISKHGRSLASLAGWSMPSSRNLWDILKREQIEGHDARHIRDIWVEVSSIFFVKVKILPSGRRPALTSKKLILIPYT